MKDSKPRKSNTGVRWEIPNNIYTYREDGAGVLLNIWAGPQSPPPGLTSQTG